MSRLKLVIRRYNYGSGTYSTEYYLELFGNIRSFNGKTKIIPVVYQDNAESGELITMHERTYYAEITSFVRTGRVESGESLHDLFEGEFVERRNKQLEYVAILHGVAKALGISPLEKPLEGR